MIFIKSEAIFLVTEDYHFSGFHVMWPVRSALLKDWMPQLSGQETIFPKPDKVVQSSG